MSKEFIDKHAERGGQHDSLSRTLATRKKQKIKIRYDAAHHCFTLDIPDYKPIKITTKNALKLANWILELE